MSNELYDDFTAWLKRINNSQPPGSDITALNFGLFETEDGFVTYLTGSRVYDPNDDDWACSIDWSPEEKYFNRLAEFTAGVGWMNVLEIVIALVKLFLDSLDGRQSFLSNNLVVTVGFDDGDLMRVK